MEADEDILESYQDIHNHPGIVKLFEWLNDD